MKITVSVTKSSYQDCGPCYLHLPIFFLINTLSYSAPKSKIIVQAFTNYVHGYDHEGNVHASDVTRTRNSVHGIGTSVLKLFKFANLSVLFCPVLGWFYHVLLPLRALNCENCQLVLSICHKWELIFTCSHRPLWFKNIRKTTTTAFLISNTVVPNPCSHSRAFDPQSFTQLS